jgi:hypothetical protein
MGIWKKRFLRLFKKANLDEAGPSRIDIAELSSLWIEKQSPESGGSEKSDTPDTLCGEGERDDKIDDTPQLSNHEINEPKPNIDLKSLISGTPAPYHEKDAGWFNEKAFMEILKKRVDQGLPSAFIMDGVGYFNLEVVTDCLNTLRLEAGLSELAPKEVIRFSAAGFRLQSHKYALRFNKGEPSKTYLYSVPIGEMEIHQRNPPLDGEGRRLKSVKRLSGP